MENTFYKPLPDNPDEKLLSATYICKHCGESVKGLVSLYRHIAHEHDTTRPLFSGKKARRKPLASELLEAMEMAKAGIARAARQLNVSVAYFTKWAEILIPDQWAEYKTRSLKGIVTKGSIELSKTHAYKLSVRVLSGEIPAPKSWYLEPQKKLAQLQRYGLLHDSCQLCGFNEHRLSDYKAPMLVDYIDGDKYNWQLSNLQILCYNCYFLTVRDLRGNYKHMALGHNFKKGKE